jgi:hypothetical protein
LFEELPGLSSYVFADLTNLDGGTGPEQTIILLYSKLSTIKSYAVPANASISFPILLEAHSKFTYRCSGVGFPSQGLFGFETE